MNQRGRWLLALLVLTLALVATAPALAAEVAGGDTYRLEAGEVVSDDLYVSAEQVVIAGTVEGDLFAAGEDPAPTQAEQALAWLTRTALVLLGFALLGGLLLRFWPAALTRPARAIAAQPGRASLYGVLALLGLMLLPLVSALLVFLMVLFWGWWPGVVLGLALFGVLGVLWFLSPLITGVWLGRWLSRRLDRAPDAWLAALGGVLLLALLTQIPYLGWLVATVSFVLALGGLALARRTRREPVAPITAA